MRRTMERLVVGLNWVAGGFILVMLAITVMDVFGKFVLNMPFKGTLEVISYYCLIGSVFLALPYVALKREHISSEIMYTNLSEPRKKGMDIFAAIVSLLFFAIFAYYMCIEAYRSFLIREEAFGSVFIPIWPSKMMMPVGLVFSLIVVLSYLRMKPFRDDEAASEE